MADSNTLDNNALNNNTPDYDLNRDDALDTSRNVGATEPATKHDVGIGGGLGLIGGAVVGALAGGPVGAVVGAVVGGAASAGAVDVVDKHDHDYARTVNTNDTTTLSSAPTGTTTGYPTVVTGYSATVDEVDFLDEEEDDSDIALDHPNRLAC